MIRISSRYTLFGKVVLPSLLGLLAVLATWKCIGDLNCAQASGNTNDPVLVFAGILAFAIMVVGALWLCLPLKKVVLGRQGVIVSNYLHEVVVPYSEVAQIRQYFGTPWLFVSIVLKQPCQFGLRIWYLARVSSLAWFGDHRDTALLMRRCGLLRGPGQEDGQES